MEALSGQLFKAKSFSLCYFPTSLGTNRVRGEHLATSQSPATIHYEPITFHAEHTLDILSPEPNRSTLSDVCSQTKEEN